MNTVIFVALVSLLVSVKIEAASIDKISSPASQSPSSVVNLSEAGINNNVAPDNCILSVMFNENSLKYFEADFLVRLYEAEMRRTDSVLPGRKREIKNALISKIQESSDAETAHALFYAFSEKFFLVFDLMIRTFSDRIPEIIDLLEFSQKPHLKELAQVLQMAKARLNGDDSFESSEGSDDSSFEMIKHSSAVEEIYKTVKLVSAVNFTPQKRLPAVLRIHLNDPNLQDSEVDSKFLKRIIFSGTGAVDLNLALALYEVEMMDILHAHDRRGVIEKQLKKLLRRKSNEPMIRLALEMYENRFWNALKLIIDVKFSRQPWLKNPIFLYDLAALFKRAEELEFPQGFYEKILELASPDAVRRYMTRTGSSEPESIADYEEVDDVDGVSEEDQDDNDLETLEYFLN